ncbi:MAG: 1-acyl-sn-glycerol-3-phosphate acyltransferase, partial [Pseudomonadales bacterium]|nr:1-acyl-sn-glycerol-3-phosphate acyltransferase [Pseudomonadales bacterium]
EGLASNEIFCIFPEGRLTPTGEMMPFQRGIERILRESPVQVVPVALSGLWGSYFSKAPNARKLPKRVRVSAGEPISADEVTASALHETVLELRGAAR